MGPYIGSMLAKLGNSYLDEQQNQQVLARQRTLDANAEAEKRALMADRSQRTILEQLKMDFDQREAERKTQQMEQERQQLDAALANAGVTDPIQRKAMTQDLATARSYLTKPKGPVVKPEDVYTEQQRDGGTARMKNGHFDSWIIRPQQEKETSPAQQMIQEQKMFQRTQGLANDFAQDPVVKQAKLYASAYQGLVAAGSKNDPQSNLAMMYEAVKMRDPNAVREGELALQKSARSVPDWLRQMWNKAESGNVLSENERNLILRWAGQKVSEQGKIVRPVQERFGMQARRWGVSPDSSYIAPDPFAGINVNPNNPYSGKRKN